MRSLTYRKHFKICAYISWGA